MFQSLIAFLIFKFNYLYKACKRRNIHLKHIWSADVCLCSIAVKVIPLKWNPAFSLYFFRYTILYEVFIYLLHTKLKSLAMEACVHMPHLPSAPSPVFLSSWSSAGDNGGSRLCSWYFSDCRAEGAMAASQPSKVQAELPSVVGYLLKL